MNKILVVEDDPEAMDSTTELLRAQGYEVLQARDGPEAVSTILTQHPQLVTLDLELPSPDPTKCPVFDGYKVLRWLSRMKEKNRIPTIVLTGTAASIGKEKAMELGACAYLEKPFDTQKLLTAIQIALDEI